MIVLRHFTCAHTHATLGDEGVLLPGATLRPDRLASWAPSHYVWATNLRLPLREALGLTSNYTHCDRTEYRYLIDPDDQHLFVPWVKIRRTVEHHQLLESAEGARPAHWWVSPEPVRVTLEP